MDFRKNFGPNLGFSTKKGFKIRDPRISWYPFGTKNHEIWGPPVVATIKLLASYTSWMVRDWAWVSTGATGAWHLPKIWTSPPADFEVLNTNWHPQSSFYVTSGTLSVKFLTQALRDVVSSIKYQDISKLECQESTYTFWIASNIIFFALSTIWMVKKIPTRKQFFTNQPVVIKIRVIYLINYIIDHNISKPDCNKSTYVFWIGSNIIFFALSTTWMVKDVVSN